MTVAIMQPYFFPYLGYFQLISAVDKWVVFDTPQYIRHGWINRNRILKPDRNDFQYINVPLKKHPRDASINEVQIAEPPNWRVKLLGQLEHYKKVAPFFLPTIEVVNQGIDIVTDNIVELNCNVLKTICDYLGIQFNYEVYSMMNLKHEKQYHAGEWALQISSALGAKSYINPLGGVELFDKSQFDKAEIKLHFITPQLKQYDQKNNLFIPGLSIIDVMMFNAVMQIKDEINKFKIINL